MTAPDPLHFACAHTERGERCANLGTFSRSVLGADHWFCRQHFFPQDPPYVPVRYESIANLDPAEKKHDGKDWARRVLKRQRLGERLPSISIEFAREALGLTPERQPGEDDA